MISAQKRLAQSVKQVQHVEHAAILEQVKGIVSLAQTGQASLNKRMEIHLLNEPRWQRGVDDKLDDVIKKLTDVMNIRVNGTKPLPGEFPLMTSLRGIHDVIHPQKVKREFWDKFREYRRASWFFQIFQSKLVRMALIVSVFLGINTIAKHFDIPLTFNAFMKLVGMGN